jgi:hypothetical protein
MVKKKKKKERKEIVESQHSGVGGRRIARWQAA